MMPFQDDSSVTVLCLCVGGFIHVYGVCFVRICSSALLRLALLEGCGSELCYFLGIFIYFTISYESSVRTMILMKREAVFSLKNK